MSLSYRFANLLCYRRHKNLQSLFRDIESDNDHRLHHLQVQVPLTENDTLRDKTKHTKNRSFHTDITNDHSVLKL